MNRPHGGGGSARTPKGHGRTGAAWASVSVVMFGALLSCVAIVISPAVWWLFWAGLVIAALGPAVGKALSIAGYGEPAGYSEQQPLATTLEGPDLDPEFRRAGEVPSS
jgi:hypothetical protein